MKSWMYISIFIIIALIMSGIILYNIIQIQNIDFELVTVPKKNSYVEKRSDNITRDWQIYKNEKYGFEMKLPGDMTKWTFKEKESNKDCTDCISGRENIFFMYQLDSPILIAENQPSLGIIENMELWFIDIIPTKEYQNNFCQGKNYPCRLGEILAQNEKYVFLAGFTNIEGAGYTCLRYPEKLKNFCTVDSNFGLKNFNNLINFKLLKNNL